ncbi:BspA family leucine-rich repeat surface protein [Bifidobacterium sp. ESL0745]|uniref:BspA family leucine-rich repeat surface protein n=1 Tax=Bifidobacterium sp. ESL0745 TaxID=2983226 RepID=UPI0023F75A00|nr:BspA family leucine-rich repeat surface protein [Bifidobacterium sp. ESL0745]MDF7666197.1 BspA family leucine-rich repeat surface protein [Bifidobacterium sp. ESL0745]
MNADNKMAKVLGAVVAAAMLCGVVTVSATAGDVDGESGAQTSSEQQADVKAKGQGEVAQNDGQAAGSSDAAKVKPQLKAESGDRLTSTVPKKAGSAPAPQAQTSVQQQAPQAQSEVAAPQTRAQAPQAQGGTQSPLLGQEPTTPTVTIVYGNDGAFKLTVKDGSWLDFRSDGRYTYHSFDNTEVSVAPNELINQNNDDGSLNSIAYSYPYGSPVPDLTVSKDSRQPATFNTLEALSFSRSSGSVINDIYSGYKYGYSVSRNDSWQEDVELDNWGNASLIKNRISQGYGSQVHYNIQIGPGTVGSARRSPWLGLADKDASYSLGSQVSFTDPEHTFLPADSSSMFARISNPGLLNFDEIGKLDTSNVTNMSHMFDNSPVITGTASFKGWKTSNVTDMSYMFHNTKVSEISALSHWDLSKVQTMAYMFSDATDLQNIDDAKNLELHSLTDMSWMFSEDGKFTDVSVMGTWDTSHVTTMKGLFSGAQGFDGLPSTESLTELRGVDKINMDAVTDASQMFAYNQNLKSIGGIGKLQVSNVNSIASMFCDDWALTELDLHAWNTKNITDMSYAFAMDNPAYYGSGMSDSEKNMNSHLASIDLSGWNTSAATNLSRMFTGCSRLVALKGIASWQTGSVQSINGIFWNCYKLSTLDLSRWDISSIWDMDSAFRNFGKEAGHVDLASLKGWDFAGRSVDVSNMFDGCAAETLPVAGWSMGGVPYTQGMFSNMPNLKTLDVSKWDTRNDGDMGRMFQNDPKLESVDVSNWKTDNLRETSDMFNGDSSLTSVGSMAANAGTGAWKVEDYFYSAINMFKDCPKLKSLDLSGWNLRYAASDYKHIEHVGNNTYCHADLGIDNMFSGDSALESLDLSGWNVPHVTTVKNMFAGTSSLKNLDLSGWDASSVTSFSNTFTGAGAPDGMKLDLSNWKVNNTVSIELPLRDANVSAVDLTGWDTTANTGFQPRFSAKLRQLTVGPKTVLRPEYFVEGVEPGGLTRGISQYTGQWAEASAKPNAVQTCTAADGSSYTAHGEAWNSCGRPAGTGATAAMMNQANAHPHEATYLWEQHALVHFAGLDPTKPTASYDDTAMAPKDLYGADGESIKVDDNTTPVDVHGMFFTLPEELKAEDYKNVGWLRDDDPMADIQKSQTRMWVPGGEWVVRAMWEENKPTPKPEPSVPATPSKPGNPGTSSKPETPDNSSNQNGSTNQTQPSKPSNPSASKNPTQPAVPAGSANQTQPGKPSKPEASDSGSASGPAASSDGGLAVAGQSSVILPVQAPLAAQPVLAQALPALPAASAVRNTVSPSGVAAGAAAPQANALGGGVNSGAPAPRVQTPSPSCIENEGVAYVLDAAGYVVPTVEHCSTASSAAPVSANNRSTFPWWIALLLLLFLIPLAKRNRFVIYARHRSPEETER